MTDDERMESILAKWGPTLERMAKGDPPSEADIAATVAHMRKMRDEIVFLRGLLGEAAKERDEWKAAFENRKDDVRRLSALLDDVFNTLEIEETSRGDPEALSLAVEELKAAHATELAHCDEWTKRAAQVLKERNALQAKLDHLAPILELARSGNAPKDRLVNAEATVLELIEERDGLATTLDESENLLAEARRERKDALDLLGELHDQEPGAERQESCEHDWTWRGNLHHGEWMPCSKCGAPVPEAKWWGFVHVPGVKHG